MRNIGHWSVAAAMLLAAGAASAGAAGKKGGVVLSLKAGSSATLPPDGKSQAVLVVNINPKAAEWGTAVDAKGGRFSLRVTWYGKGKLTPKRADKVRFPTYITVTSWKLPDGVHTQQAAVVVNVTYTPPGDTTGRRAKTCSARKLITVTSKPITAAGKIGKKPAPKPNKNAELVAAVRAADVAKVRKLLGEGANPNVRHVKQNWRPLHFAVLGPPAPAGGKLPKTASEATVKTRLKLIGLLLDAGANINARDKQSATPLHLAAFRGQTTQVVRLLLDRGADMTAKMQAFRDPRSAKITTPAAVAGQAPPPWNERLHRVLTDAVKDKGWKPAYEYANCHSYTIFLLTGENRMKTLHELQTPALEKVLRGLKYMPLPNRSRGMKLSDEAILGRLRHGDVLVIGNRHSATARMTASGLRFLHFAGQTVYDSAGKIKSRSDLGGITIDAASGKRTYRKPGEGGQIAGAAPGPKRYEIHSSPRANIAAMSRGIKPWGTDPVMIWRRLGQYKYASWYLVADRTTFTSTSDTGHTDSDVRTFSLRYDVAGKFEDKPGSPGIRFTGARNETDPKTGAKHEATLTAFFDDRLEKVVSLKIEHSITLPDRGAIKGRKTDLVLEAKDIEVRRVYGRTILCRTAAPEKHISSINHTSRQGRWTTTLGKVATKKVGWLELTFHETRPRRRP